MKFFGLSLHIGRDLVLMILLAVVGIIDFGIHLYKVDYSAEGGFLAYGQLDGDGVG